MNFTHVAVQQINRCKLCGLHPDISITISPSDPSRSYEIIQVRLKCRCRSCDYYSNHKTAALKHGIENWNYNYGQP